MYLQRDTSNASLIPVHYHTPESTAQWLLSIADSGYGRFHHYAAGGVCVCVCVCTCVSVWACISMYIAPLCAVQYLQMLCTAMMFISFKMSYNSFNLVSRRYAGGICVPFLLSYHSLSHVDLSLQAVELLRRFEELCKTQSAVRTL